MSQKTVNFVIRQYMKIPNNTFEKIYPSLQALKICAVFLCRRILKFCREMWQ